MSTELVKDRKGFSILEENFTTQKVVVTSDWISRGPHEKAMQENSEFFYGNLLPVLRNADLTIVNVETVLGDLGKPIWKGGPTLKSSGKMTRALEVVPFHLACLANNHVRDYGAEGLAETIKLLHQAGIDTIGAGCCEEEITKPSIIKLGDTTLGILNVAEGESSLPPYVGAPGVASMDLQRIEKQISTLKEKIDVIMLIVHAGREYVPAPPPYIQEAYREMLRYGADVVIGHHPHVPQGIEIYQGRPIVYSLGNFAFWQPAPNPYQHLGYMVELEFKGSRLVSLAVIPYKILSDGLTLLEGEEEKHFYTEFQMISRLLYDSKKVAELWEAYVDIFYERTGGTKLVFDYSDQHSAAKTANCFRTITYSEMIITMMERVRDETIGTSPKWARDLVSRWMGISDS